MKKRLSDHQVAKRLVRRTLAIFAVYALVTMLLRIPASVEIEGVDPVLHGTAAYPGTIMDTNDGTPTSMEAIGKAGVSRATAAAD